VIVKARRLKNFKLSVSEERKPGRPHGWSKLHTIDKEGNGAINIEWHQSTKMLVCRAVTKGAGAQTSSLAILSITCWLAIGQK